MTLPEPWGVIIELGFSAFAGVVLGTVYFGGLWLTVRHAAHSRRPGLAMTASFWLRLAVMALGLYWLADGRWPHYAAAIPGLLLARWLWIRRIESARVSRCN